MLFYTGEPPSANAETTSVLARCSSSHCPLCSATPYSKPLRTWPVAMSKTDGPRLLEENKVLDAQGKPLLRFVASENDGLPG